MMELVVSTYIISYRIHQKLLKKISVQSENTNLNISFDKIYKKVYSIIFNLGTKFSYNTNSKT